MHSALVAAAAAPLLLLAAACASSSDAPTASSERPLEEGQTLGRIDRLPGGTAVPVDVRTMLGAECEDGVLTFRSNLETILADMNCDQMLPLSITERFFGKPVAITYRENRLIVENDVTGTLEFPVSNARVAAALGADATP